MYLLTSGFLNLWMYAGLIPIFICFPTSFNLLASCPRLSQDILTRAFAISSTILPFPALTIPPYARPS
jgi:hypothetical protein